MFALFLLLLFLLTIIFFIHTITKTKPSKNLLLPPSPSKLPIIGNLHQLGPFPHSDLQRLAYEQGPLMLLHLGLTPTLVVSSAAAARDIMKTHDLTFSSRPSLQFADRLLYGKDIAFTPYGEYWRQMRRVVTLHLLSSSKVESFRSIREQETLLLVEKIRQSCKVDFYEALMSLTNDVVCRVALGGKYSEREGGRGFREMIRQFVALLGVFNVGDFIPGLAWVNRFNGLNSKVEKVFRELDCFLERVIQDHSDDVDRKERDGDHVEDFVDLLLRIQRDGSLGVSFSRDNIKAIILDVFAAGTDTTFTVLDWTMSELIRHPQILKELQEEIRKVTGRSSKPYVTEDILHEMHYLKMVIKETMRLHPPIPLLVPRESVEDVKIQGYDIPANTRVIVNAWAIGRDPRSYENPQVFEPKRFMNSSVDFKGNNFELIPFGAGRRICPGIVFAMDSVELALANLLYHFDWKIPDGGTEKDLDMTEGSGLTVHRKTHLVLVATPHHH